MVEAWARRAAGAAAAPTRTAATAFRCRSRRRWTGRRRTSPLLVFARGLLKPVLTRVYFPDEAEANAADPVLAALAEAERARLVGGRRRRRPALRHPPPGPGADGVLRPVSGVRGDLRAGRAARRGVRSRLAAGDDRGRARAGARRGERRRGSRRRGRRHRRALHADLLDDGRDRRRPGGRRTRRSRWSGGCGRRSAARRPTTSTSARPARTSSTRPRCWWRAAGAAAGARVPRRPRRALCPAGARASLDADGGSDVAPAGGTDDVRPGLRGLAAGGRGIPGAAGRRGGGAARPARRCGGHAGRTRRARPRRATAVCRRARAGRADRHLAQRPHSGARGRGGGAPSAPARRGKIGGDIVLLSQTEIGEVRRGRRRRLFDDAPEAQPRRLGAGGGRRPAGHGACGDVAAGLRRTSSQRAAGAWQAEWEPFAGVLAYTGGRSACAAEALAGLSVDPSECAPTSTSPAARSWPSGSCSCRRRGSAGRRRAAR